MNLVVLIIVLVACTTLIGATPNSRSRPTPSAERRTVNTVPSTSDPPPDHPTTSSCPHANTAYRPAHSPLLTTPIHNDHVKQDQRKEITTDTNGAGGL